jgi:hypothetical protein
MMAQMPPPYVPGPPQLPGPKPKPSWSLWLIFSTTNPDLLVV